MLATLLDKSALKDMDIAFVVDSNVHYQGKMIGELSIKKPEVIRDYPHLPIIVAAGEVATRSILEMLESMDVKNRLVSLGDR